jgi:hypothetical protein
LRIEKTKNNNNKKMLENENAHGAGKFSGPENFPGNPKIFQPVSCWLSLRACGCLNSAPRLQY